MEALQILSDPIASIQKRPEQYLDGAALPKGHVLTHLVLRDVLFFGSKSVNAVEIDGWWVVQSELDWMKIERYAIEELFKKLVPLPDQGHLRHRSEVIVAAFARSIYTFAASDHRVIKESKDILLPNSVVDLSKRPSVARTLAFYA